MSEQTARRLQHAPGQVGLVSLVGDLPHAGEADRHPDETIGVSGEVLRHLVIVLFALVPVVVKPCDEASPILSS